jgi:hypothetical protein
MPTRELMIRLKRRSDVEAAAASGCLLDIVLSDAAHGADMHDNDGLSRTSTAVMNKAKHLFMHAVDPSRAHASEDRCVIVEQAVAQTIASYMIRSIEGKLDHTTVHLAHHASWMAVLCSREDR